MLATNILYNELQYKINALNFKEEFAEGIHNYESDVFMGKNTTSELYMKFLIVIETQRLPL